MQESDTTSILREILLRLEEICLNLKENTLGEQMSNKWLFSADVKRMLSISDSTLKRMRKNKEIPCQKIGRTYFYPSAYFDTILPKKVLSKK